MEAALGGAKNNTFVDSDINAIELTKFNWKLNNLTNDYSTVTSKTIPFLNQCKQDNKKFDAIVIDPPVTINYHDEIERLTQKAIEVLHRGGVLVTSCSLPSITFDRLASITGAAATKAERFAKIIKFGHQSSSFPVAATFPESAYLKCLFTRIY